jgi:hypothetical protein
MVGFHDLARTKRVTLEEEVFEDRHTLDTRLCNAEATMNGIEQNIHKTWKVFEDEL